VIELEWSQPAGETRDELARLLADAADADAEAGFSSFSLDDRVPEGTRYLLIWLLPDDRDGHTDHVRQLAGCLRLEPVAGDPGAAEARLVIHPEYRSRGVVVMLGERLGTSVDGDGGWAGTGFTRLFSWARGNHPAAIRLTLRFGSLDGSADPAGLRRTLREWRLVVPLSRDADLETLVGLRELPEDVVAELREQAGRPGYDADPVLDKALSGLREAGALIGAIVVDDRRHELLAVCRSLGFQHDRTDARYDLG
jgi:mycothiol synthase